MYLNKREIDQTLLAQILLRLRNLEDRLGGGGGGGFVRQFVQYGPTVPLESAVEGVTIVFAAPASPSSPIFSTAPNGTIFNFANVTTSEIPISDGTSNVMTLVPGEFTSLVKLNGAWYGTLGII